MLPGGVMEGQGVDAAVAAHYGDPTAEARALESAHALVDLSQLEFISVTGPERLTWLHLFTSQHLSALAPEQSTETLILDPAGHVEHAAAVVEKDGTTWLITEPGYGTQLQEFLESMRFAARVEIAGHPELAAVGVLNAAAAPVNLTALLAPHPRWQDPWPRTTGTSYGPPDPEHPAANWDFTLHWLPRAALPDLAQQWVAAGGTLAGTLALEAARIAAYRPRLGREVDERTIPHELDWLRTAVHLDKGCYRGQETVARVVNLGKPPRRLTFLHLDGSTAQLPSPQDPVLAGDRVVGHVTSAARHHELGPIALAILRRSVDPAVPLAVQLSDDAAAAPTPATAPQYAAAEPEGPHLIAATQEEIVSAAGISAATPKVRPGQGLRASPARNPGPGFRAQ